MYSRDDFCVIAAVNSPEILASCLARSPDIASGDLPLESVIGAKTMAQAYNGAIDRTTRAVMIFAHQDVYFPAGWLDRAVAALNRLSIEHPDWLVAGPYGVRAGGEHVGRVWDTTLDRELGDPGFPPTEIESLDELVLILRRDAAFRFDPDLPDFHLYGTDIVQMAKAIGRSAFAVELPVVHHNRPVSTLRGGYLRAYRYARRKWRANLPIWTTISAITYCPFPLWRAQWRTRHVSKRPDSPVGDAKEIAQALGYE